MIHQPAGGMEGTAADIHIQAQEMLRVREVLNEILSRHSGQTMEAIARDSDRDKFMSAEEAKTYGLVDEVLVSKPRKTAAT